MATSDAKPILTTLPVELELNIASHLPQVEDLIQLKRTCTTLRDVVNEHAPPRWVSPPTEDGEGETDVLTKEDRVAMGLPVLKGKGGKGLRYALRQGGELERLRAAADGDVQGEGEGGKDVGADLMMKAKMLELVEILEGRLYYRPA
ncbi:hypothetical protein B0A55_00587 [Friedmanniomyces simplex]|uniref:F-box domain-containing protein n=1 Tax=Friedmanniomyces simplex TaxID=329884 RepID=A0A4U0Y222_9PEZI|nr:hypothetical protein B0A55_00587 [Friedmanniomyces simplex]